MPSPTTHGKGLDIPADGVEFELTLNDPAPDPIDMVRGDGYSNAADWKYNGKGATPRTGRFKLMRTGYQPNLARVRQKLGEENVPEGQWREAFKKVYPRPDGKGPIGFADPSWGRPLDLASFPVLHETGEAWCSNFVWAGLGRHDRWRWLVACK